jgi:hypothetical protein
MTRELCSKLLGRDTSRLVKKTHMLIDCPEYAEYAQSPCYNVEDSRGTACRAPTRFFARLASEIFLSTPLGYFPKEGHEE